MLIGRWTLKRLVFRWKLKIALLPLLLLAIFLLTSCSESSVAQNQDRASLYPGANVPAISKNVNVLGAIKGGTDTLDPDSAKSDPPIVNAVDAKIKEGGFKDPCSVPITRLSGKLSSEDIEEASGLARHSKLEDHFFIHNDSGDGPYIYLNNIAGQQMAKYKIDDFEPDDVEDITTLPCPDQVDTTCLALADVGDNKKKRKSYAIIIVKEPQPPFQDSTLKIVKKIKFTYPFGPRNCETIFYSQSDKKIIGVTKTKRGESGKVYSLDPKLLDQQAKVISNFPLDSMSFRDGIVTGGAINSSSLVALRLYQYLEIFRWQGIEKGGLKYLFRFKHSLEKQGEAVEFSADGKKLLTISEGNNPHFFRVELDKAVDCLFH